MNKNNITKKQLEILTLLYRFRFLNRSQIQKLIHHQYFNRVIIWLNQLTATNHIQRYYNPKTVTIPAIYSLGIKGRKYLKQSNLKGINKTLLDRVWQEKKLSDQFKKHCLLIADIYSTAIDYLPKAYESKQFFATVQNKLHFAITGKTAAIEKMIYKFNC